QWVLQGFTQLIKPLGPGEARRSGKRDGKTRRQRRGEGVKRLPPPSPRICQIEPDGRNLLRKKGSFLFIEAQRFAECKIMDSIMTTDYSVAAAQDLRSFKLGVTD
ncbi:hypothetical protein U1Q18_009697, partial [Sarracenia purpurea var. burkii]